MTNIWTKSPWYVNIERKVEEETENLYKRDVTFFQIERLLKLAEKIDYFARHSEQAEAQKKVIEEIVGNLSTSINSTIGTRNEYERKLESVADYLKKEHGIRPKKYYQSLYALIGIFGGIVVGYAIGQIYGGSGFLKFALLLGFAIGLMVGRILGNRKEKWLSENNLLI